MDIGRRLPLEQKCSYPGQQGDVSQSVRVTPFAMVFMCMENGSIDHRSTGQITGTVANIII